jgi:Uma2 family endonuclease
MSAASATVSAVPPSALAGRGGFVQFTTHDVRVMLQQGILPEDSTTELLNGLLVLKDRSDLGGDSLMHGPKHGACIRKLTAFVPKVDGSERHAQVQLPIVCATDQMPEPDFAVVRGTDADYAEALPTAADTFMVLEAADSSLERDRDEKRLIYAAAGIAQYIILNLRGETALVSSEPDRSTATYAKTESVSKGDAISLRVGEGQYLSVPLADLLP